MVERIPIWCSDNNNNFNIISKMRLESEILREAINDCGSMIRKYQDDETKKTFVDFGGDKLSYFPRKERKLLKQEHKDRKEVLDYLT